MRDTIEAIAAIVIVVLAVLGLCAVLSACSFETPREDAPDATSSVDAAPARVTLRQTDDGVIDPAVGSVAHCASGAQSWFRVFDLADEGISGALAATDVALRVAYAHNASGVQVKIGTFAAAMGQRELAMGAITWLASSTIDVPEAGGPYGVNVGGSMPAAIIPANGRVIVGVFAPALPVGDLRLGFTDGAERVPAYFGASSCGTATPATTASLGELGHLVLEVSGWVAP